MASLQQRLLKWLLSKYHFMLGLTKTTKYLYHNVQKRRMLCNSNCKSNNSECFKTLIVFLFSFVCAGMAIVLACICTGQAELSFLLTRLHVYSIRPKTSDYRDRFNQWWILGKAN